MQNVEESLVFLPPLPLPLPSRNGLRPLSRPEADFALALALELARLFGLGAGAPGAEMPAYPWAPLRFFTSRSRLM
eukprot:7134761-Alexandrium_andersonii.AAC.1